MSTAHFAPTEVAAAAVASIIPSPPGSLRQRIVIITDAWRPQINGVVTTLEQIQQALIEQGHEVSMITPPQRGTLPCPGYNEIRLSLRPGTIIRKALSEGSFDSIHIATEGPLGIAARRYCRRHGLRFSTAAHTRLDEYLSMRLPLVPVRWGRAWMRRFHAAGDCTMVRSESQRQRLQQNGYQRLSLLPGAVDTRLFRPRDKDFWKLPRPLALYTGRVAMEKNLQAFLRLDLPGSKVIIGDGPARKRLQQQWPDAHFIGFMHGEMLARAMAAADVFVFPSRTDTLGLVMLEAMACGVPVAAYPVPGPLDVVRDGVTGALDEDLQAAVFRALACAPEDCREHAESYDLRSLAQRFLQGLAWPAANDVLQPVAPMQCIDSETAPCIYADQVYNDIPWPAQTSPAESSTPRVN